MLIDNIMKNESVLLKLVLGISLVTAQAPGCYESANFISN